MSAASDAIFEKSWVFLQTARTPQAVFVPQLSACLFTGEHIMLSQPFQLANGAQGCVGRVLSISDSSFLLQLYVSASYANGHILPRLSRLRAPVTHPYYEYPEEVIPTNLVRSYHVSRILSEAFVFSTTDVEERFPALCVGMSNAFCVRFRWTSDTSLLLSLLLDIEYPFKSFPVAPSNSYGRLCWARILQLAISLQRLFSVINSTQSPTRSIKFIYDPTDWEYLKRRLSPISIFDRYGVSSVKMVRARAYLEQTRFSTKKEVIRIDSIEKLNILKGLLGNFTLSGVRKGFPSVPKLSAGLQFRKAHDALDNVDNLNTMIVLPAATTGEEKYVHNPKGRGLDLKYDPTIRTLIVTVRCSSISASNPVLRADLGLDPVAPDPADIDEDGQSAELQIGDDLGNDEFHCQIIAFTVDGMVNVVVIESVDDDYMQHEVYSLTRENAWSLKREYES
jgi:hypothetical protein